MDEGRLLKIEGDNKTERLDKDMEKEKLTAYIHKVQYYETDQMGIVHHSNYIRWFEEARTDILEKVGMSYQVMEERGVISPVLEAHAQYKTMTHFGDTVRIRMKVKSYNGITLAIGYEVSDQNTGEIRCVGETKHCFLDRDGKILFLKRVKPDMHQAFCELMEALEQE